MNATNIILPTRYGWEPFRTLSNDERLAAWASKYFCAGHHRRPRVSTATNASGSLATHSEATQPDRGLRTNSSEVTP
jgi:hypothetical protein